LEKVSAGRLASGRGRESMRKKLKAGSLFGSRLAAVAALLPQTWLIGVTAAMIHRLGLLVYEWKRAHIHRRHFRRLGYSFLALASAEGSRLWMPLGRMAH
jgi:hypothetical protein